MKIQMWKKGAAVFLALLLGIQMPFAMESPWRQAYAYTERQAVVNASSLNVRSGPGTSYSRVMNLAKGTSVTVINETTGSDGKLWYQIRSGGSTGYVLGTYLRFPVSYSQDSNFEAYLNGQGFPESYKPALRQLHAQYPNWVFEAHQTGLDWNTVIQNESIIPRSLIHKNSISSHKSTADGAYDWDNGTWTGFDGSAWVAASEDIIRYYMDPRNFLDDVYIFQFMSHGYDASTQTRDGLQAMVRGTFLDGSTTGAGTWTGGSGTGGSSYGPGGSSSGVVVSPGGSGSGGPGVSGGGGTNSSISGGGNGPGGNGGTSQSPGNTGGQQVRLRSPSASVSRHDVPRVASSVRVGVKPGQDGSGGTSSPGGNSQGGTSPSPGGGSSLSPGGSLQGGGTSLSPGGSLQGGTSSSPVVSPGGGASSYPGGHQNGSSSPAVPGGNGSGDSSSGAYTSGNGGTISYVDVIMQAAQVSGVNPYVLAAMIIQEQGSDGRGNSIKGNNSSYPGYYNYFNVGAYAAGGMGAVERGLWYASQNDSYGRPWNTPEKSIIGGAQFYGENYVRAGQDTFYLKKYNVQGSNLYKHQYMTNVDGAASEGSIFAESYSDRLKTMPLRFKIPVYRGMPDSPCMRPTGDGSPNNKLKGLGVEGFSLTPTFSRDTYSYNLIVDNSVSTVSVYATAIDQAASLSGTGNFQISAGTNEIRVRVRAQNGSERDYVIYVVRQGGGPTYNSSIGGGSSPATGPASPSGNTSAGQMSPVIGPGGGGSANTGAGGSPLGSGATPGGNNVIIISP